jgi:hypothetical protein
MIYLLDLNYTLVANSENKRSPFIHQIAAEIYREALVERLQGERVFLLTARPAKYETATLASIKAKAGWQPERAFFNSYGLPPPIAKQEMLKKIMPEFPREKFFGIESNPATRAMYARHGIESSTWADFLK